MAPHNVYKPNIHIITPPPQAFQSSPMPDRPVLVNTPAAAQNDASEVTRLENTHAIELEDFHKKYVAPLEALNDAINKESESLPSVEDMMVRGDIWICTCRSYFMRGIIEDFVSVYLGLHFRFQKRLNSR